MKICAVLNWTIRDGGWPPKLLTSSLWSKVNRSQQRMRSSGAIIYTEDEAEEMEVVIGELTKQLYEMRQVRKHKYVRNRFTVSQFR